MKIETIFDLGDHVYIVPIDKVIGRVVDISIASGYVEHRVRYFNNGEEKYAYFKADELARVLPVVMTPKIEDSGEGF